MIDSLFKTVKYLINPPQFVVKIENEQTVAVKGSVSKALLADFAEICVDEKVESGKIYGVNNRYGKSLEFSGTIPKATHQKFRNILSFHR